MKLFCLARVALVLLDLVWDVTVWVTGVLIMLVAVIRNWRRFGIGHLSGNAGNKYCT